MRKLLDELIQKKNVLILGYGREGRSTLKLLMEVGSANDITVADARDVSEELPDGISSFCGERYLDCLDSFDIVFKSPGIVLPKSVTAYKCTFTSQTELFMQVYGERVIGVTGTKGKSTTASLLYHVMKEAGKDVAFAGNIGIPVFDIIDSLKENTVIVTELSCHQLEYAKTSPHRAVLLNIYEDHLDHYGTREKYADAKKNIYRFQKSKDILYTNSDTVEYNHIDDCPSNLVLVEKSVLPFNSFDDISGAKLKGEHNLSNVAFVYEICKVYGISDSEFIRAVGSFEPLPHRLQFIGNYNGVDYYDDSISTTVKSTVNAVLSVKNAKFLLLGGMERNIAYEELVDFCAQSNLRVIVCMYESGKRFYEMYNSVALPLGAPFCISVDNLEQAVAYVRANGRKDEACLLSPAAASYGYFKNFEERGDVFATLVKKSD